MKMVRRLTNWLERRFCTPAYSGWLLGGICICFFGAAINTMAGWLYVISGISCALLFVAAILPPRSLASLSVLRQPITPVTVGDDLIVTLEIRNHGKKTVNLLRIEDIVPIVLGKPIGKPIDGIFPETSYIWEYTYPTSRRGVYRWQSVDLISGAPLGLFWCRRSQACVAIAYVYPQILPLTSCPIIDELGRDNSRREDWFGNPYQAATEGLVRAVRPYHIGDPIRLVHWRSSARYGELRVRELETITGGQEVIIALDTVTSWGDDNFEAAVTTAASLYFYAQRQALKVQLWTAATGIVHGNQQVLTVLAATHPQEDVNSDLSPETAFTSPIIWLTQTQQTTINLSPGSRRILWTGDDLSNSQKILKRDIPGMIMESHADLLMQLQTTPFK